MLAPAQLVGDAAFGGEQHRPFAPAQLDGRRRETEHRSTRAVVFPRYQPRASVQKRVHNLARSFHAALQSTLHANEICPNLRTVLAAIEVPFGFTRNRYGSF